MKHWQSAQWLNSHRNVASSTTSNVGMKLAVNVSKLHWYWLFCSLCCTSISSFSCQHSTGYSTKSRQHSCQYQSLWPSLLLISSSHPIQTALLSCMSRPLPRDWIFVTSSPFLANACFTVTLVITTQCHTSSISWSLNTRPSILTRKK